MDFVFWVLCGCEYLVGGWARILGARFGDGLGVSGWM